MKKLSILFLTIAMITLFAAPSFAQLRKDLAIVKGTVVLINSSRTEISVRDMITGKDVAFEISNIPVDVVSGKSVVVIYKVGTKKATSVRLARGQKGSAVAEAVKTYQAPKVSTSSPASTGAPAKPSKYGW